MTDIKPPFVAERDDEHPVKWQGAGDVDRVAWLTVDDAVERLARWYYNGPTEDDKAVLRAGLESGRKFRSNYAYYGIPGDE